MQFTNTGGFKGRMGKTYERIRRTAGIAAIVGVLLGVGASSWMDYKKSKILTPSKPEIVRKVEYLKDLESATRLNRIYDFSKEETSKFEEFRRDITENLQKYHSNPEFAKAKEEYYGFKKRINLEETCLDEVGNIGISLFALGFGTYLWMIGYQMRKEENKNKEKAE